MNSEEALNKILANVLDRTGLTKITIDFHDTMRGDNRRFSASRNVVEDIQVIMGMLVIQYREDEREISRMNTEMVPISDVRAIFLDEFENGRIAEPFPNWEPSVSKRFNSL